MKVTRKLVLTGIFTAIAYILMLLEMPVSFIMPPFIKLDLSELPALIASFAAGPLWGGAVCLLKNILHLMNTTTGGVGELANFLLGAAFVIPAGLVYKAHKSKRGAFWGAAIGALSAAVISLPVNYFITYPFYTNFMPMEAILGAYRIFMPSIRSLAEALAIFNIPFNFVKYMLDAAVTFLIYKRISPVLKGRQ